MAKKWMNYGDVNFLDHGGSMARRNEYGGFDVLMHSPIPGEEDKYLCGIKAVDVADISEEEMESIKNIFGYPRTVMELAVYAAEYVGLEPSIDQAPKQHGMYSANDDFVVTRDEAERFFWDEDVLTPCETLVTKDRLVAEAYGEMDDFTGKWNVNYSSVLSELIKAAGRHCESHAADVLIEINRIVEAVNTGEENLHEDIYCAIRDAGTDSDAYINSRMRETLVYGPQPYYEVYVACIRSDMEHIRISLYACDNPRLIKDQPTDDGAMRVESSMGTILVRGSGYGKDYPGISVDFVRKGSGTEAPIALIEVKEPASGDGKEAVFHMCSYICADDDKNSYYYDEDGNSLETRVSYDAPFSSVYLKTEDFVKAENV